MVKKGSGNMKNKFAAGVLTGLLSGIVIAIIVISIQTWAVPNGGSKNNLNEATETKVLNKVEKLEDYIKNYYLEEYDEGDFANGIYKGLVSSLGDPYSTYYTGEEYQKLLEMTSGKYCGIGATVSQDYKTGIITIVEPFENSPAAKGGLKPGDIISKVAGKEVTGKDISEVVSNMKGEEGTDVSLEIIRSGKTEPFEVKLVRANIEVTSIKSELLEDSIGYIRVTEFEDNTDEQFNEKLAELEKKNIKGLIIDLRNNGGGSLDTVVRMLDRILPEGMIVYTKDKNGEGMEFKSSDKEQIKIPLTVLINGNSASASEIFAGAVQDYKLGTLVGTTSFGKGIVQSVLPLNDGSAIKLTTSKYYTPKGRNIQGKGIDPDIEIELDEKVANKITITKEEDNQLQKAISTVKEKIK